VHHELELKAVVRHPDIGRARRRAAGAVPRFIGRMSDLRYDRAAELASRDEVLRVRTYHHAGGRVEPVLAWKGPTMRSPEGYKLRREIELPISGAADPGPLLGALGFRAVHAIDRDVEVYALGDAIARLESYPRMDVLLEIEGDPAAIERAVAASGIPRGEFTAESLADFVRRFEERTGLTAELAGARPSEGRT
jgi:predicted adenylyl cyclase CyaB